jgi:D-3-phosphoglycerate dehydrogenase
VAEEIADAGVELLRERFDVVLGLGWSAEELAERIEGFDGILIRSATRLDADLIERARRLRVIGRAGIGVDNVDVEAATKRGIVVANAPQSNIVAAAEHTLALMLALARNVPQAHASLVAGRWERSRFAGVEVYEKTLGVLGFGRIGQLVAARARAFGMRIVAFDPFVSAERFRELGAEKAGSPEDLYGQADFVSLHLPVTADTRGFLDAAAFGAMRDGVRVINCARGELIDDAALRAALDAGRVAGAALDVFPREPITDYPLFGYPNVVVTPHLGASTMEAQDRAGVQTAEQVVAALTGGVVSTAVNVPAIAPEDMEILGPFIPLIGRLARLAMALAEGSSVDRVELEYFGRVAERDTRLLTLAALQGVLAGRCEEEVNLVNAAALAEERGIGVSERSETVARDFTDLVRIAIVSGRERHRVAGTTLGRRNRPHLLEAWGQRFNLQLDEGAHLTLFRYPNRPGMLGRVGTLLGRHGVNISTATQGVESSDDDLNVVIVVTDTDIPEPVMRELLAEPGILEGRSLRV